MKVKAAVLYELGGRLGVEDIELADPKGNEVLVKVSAAGVCHSDISVIDGVILFPLPAVLGHEGSGVVESVGPGVDHLPYRPSQTTAPPIIVIFALMSFNSPEFVETGSLSTKTRSASFLGVIEPLSGAVPSSSAPDSVYIRRADSMLTVPAPGSCRPS